MQREDVISSNIKSVGYNDNILEVEFHNGWIYQYYDVPYSVYEQLINAPSKGKYHNAYIKYAYGYKRIK